MDIAQLTQQRQQLLEANAAIAAELEDLRLRQASTLADLRRVTATLNLAVMQAQAQAQAADTDA